MTGLTLRACALAGAVVLAVAAALTALAITDHDADGHLDAELDAPTPQSLPAVAESTAFFGHQSVGKNILDGIPSVYADAGVAQPRIVEATSPPEGGAAIAHAYLGQNGDPQSKIDAFAQALRSGFADWADVAFMKFCYVDIGEDSDVPSIFESYKSRMAKLGAEFPEVAFLYLTVPLTTEPGLKDRVKVSLGRGTDHRGDNAARERFNSLVRSEYAGTGRLVDVAALESTTPSGERVSGTVDGQAYFALYGGYAADSGHLNQSGSQVVAAGLLEVLGRAVSD